MNIARTLRYGVVSLALCVASTPSAFAQPSPIRQPIIMARLAQLCTNRITQNFPTTGPVATTWFICWREVAGNNSLANPNGLVIGPVYFRKSPTAPILSVIWDMRTSEYFVPYHPGSPRYYDLSSYNFKLTTVTTADCPASVGGATLSAHVCREIHDRGLMWKDYSGVRRGQELVLWGAIDAANYRYIQHYVFRDDGTIVGLTGATGQNLPGSERTEHTHNALWRIDIDLAGTVNSAAHLQHLENTADPGGAATDTSTALATAQGFGWQPQLHDSLAISNATLKNAQGHASSYELVPLVTSGGLTRHHEAFTQNDFWVTPYDPNQFAARNLPAYVAASAPVDNRDIVVWYKASLHHHPRDEDGEYKSGSWVGTAHAFFSGFMLTPNNLFDCTPSYTPC